MTQTLKVRVIEEITETQEIEVEAPDDLDINDQDALHDFLEEAYVQGAYNELTKYVAINERDFGLMKP